VTRVLPVAPFAAFSFVTALVLAAAAVRAGLVPDDAIRLWAGAMTASSGDVPIGRIVAAYPSIPFLLTTAAAYVTPAGTPVPALVSAAVFALIVAFWFVRFCKVGLASLIAGAATILIAFHPMMLRAVAAGPADILLAAFLFMAGSALYDLRARATATEVMTAGLALFALAFSHPIGAAITFAAVPFLAFAVRPVLVASSAFNVIVALLFPTIFGIGAFVYVSWVFPGAGWSYFAAPAENLSTWSVGFASLFGDGPTGLRALDSSLVIMAALVLGAPVALAASYWVIRRRPLIAPPAVFAASLATAAAATVLTGVFGDPAALAVGAPVLAAIVMTHVPVVRERPAAVVALLVIGWIGGAFSLAIVDPVTALRVTAALDGRAGDHDRIDALAAGGAMIGRDGILVDTENAPAIVVGRGGARGVFDPSSEPFALAVLLARLDAPFVAVPDPQSITGASDRLNKAFPTLYRDGAAGYRIVYQNITWRLFQRIRDSKVYKD
jgi:hypothetical protein